MRARLTIERAVPVVLVAALALSACYLPAPHPYVRPESADVVLECRALLQDATHRGCEARCQLRAVPVPAEGFEIDYSDPYEYACICEAAPIPESTSSTTLWIESAPTPEGGNFIFVADHECPTGCSDTRGACLDACAQLGAQPGYCERTCGAIYSRCKKRCARAARNG